MNKRKIYQVNKILKTMVTLLNRSKRNGWLVLFFLGISITLSAQNINIPNKTGPMGMQVNTKTGNLFFERADVYIPGRVLDMDISFDYNSFNYNLNSGYGNGWSFIYNIKYGIDSTGNVTITWGNGRQDVYKTGGGGAYTPPSGFFDSLSQYQTNKYLLRTKDGLKLFFDNTANRRLTSVTEPNGNMLTFAYNDSLITAITNSAGQTISLTYGNGRLNSITDANASPVQTYSYTYDAYGNLVKVKDPVGGTFQYTYLVNGPMSSIKDKNGNVADLIYYPDFSSREIITCNSRMSMSYDSTTSTTTATDFVQGASSQNTSYVYNNQGWLAQFNGACCGNQMNFNYDNQGNLLQRTDANNNIWKYTYDNRGNYISMTDPLNNTTTMSYTPDFNQLAGIVDPMGNAYAMAYDAAGNATQIIRPGGSNTQMAYGSNGDLLSIKDGNANSTTFQYDANGYLQKAQMPLNTTFQGSYDGRGNMLSAQDPNGNNYSFAYDSLNRLKQIADPLSRNVKLNYDKSGNLTSQTDPKGFVQNYSYDASDRMVRIKNPNGQVYSVMYDGMNNLIQYTDPMSNSTTLSYDVQNRLIGITDALGNGYALAYDGVGNMVSATMPNGNTINYTYDAMNRVTNGSDAIGTLGQITYDKNGNISNFTNAAGASISFTYDNLNRLTASTDPLGNSRIFTYDNNDNLLTKKDKNGNTSSYSYNALNRTVSFTDNNSNSISVQYDAVGNIKKAIDQNGNATNYEYDAANRITKMTYADGTFSQLTYDNNNKVASVLLTDGNTVNYTYDSLNRVVGKTFQDGSNYAYTYDANNRLIAATNSAGTTSYTFDAVGRVASESFNNHTTTYSYNTLAGVVTINYPNGTAVTKNYDVRNRMSSLFANNTKLLSNQYDVLNRPQQRAYANGIVTNYQYNNNNWLMNLSSNNSSLPAITYQYDKEGNKTQVARSNDPSYSETFSYDANYRLINYKQGILSGNNITSPLVQNSYVYDAVGNRTSAVLNGVSTNYSVNSLNQYTSINGTNYTYDLRGNRTFDGTYFMKYDAQGRKITDSAAGNVMHYSYDALGRRVTKSVNGVPVNYYYSGLKQIEERNGSDSVLAFQVFERALMPLLRNTGNQKYFYHLSDLNSTEAITDSTGSTVERYKYEDFGKTKFFNAQGNPIAASSINNRILFTGQEYDAQTNQYKFHYRNYDPASGTFTQRDPIGYADQMGMYQYVGNNPGSYYDALGLAPCPPTVTDVASGYISHTGNINTILRYLKELRDKYKKVKDPGVKNPFLNKFNIAIQVDNLIASAEQYLEHSSEWDSKEQDIKIAEFEANFAYLGADIAGSKGYVNPLTTVIGAVGFLDATTQEATAALWGNENSKSLSRIYSELDKGQIEFANKAMEKAKMNYDRDLRRIETAEKLFGKDRSNWTDELRETYERVMKSIQLQKEGKISWYKKTVVTPGGNDCPPNGDNGTQKPPPGPKSPGQTGSTEIIFNHDPNAIIGPDGVNTKAWVSVNDRLPYQILFENDSNATAPVKNVKITYPIDPKQDGNTFQLSSFGFNGMNFTVPNGLNSYYQRLDARDSIGLFVDVTAGLDGVNHQAFWIFQSIDPVTQLPTNDALKGFLLKRDTTKPNAGNGYVNFSIKPLTTAHTGDTMSAYASIVFDANDSMLTNHAFNTIDALPPTTHMNSFVQNTADPNKFRISWHGHDDAGGSGLASYSLFVSVNGGSYTLFSSNITDTFTVFTGVPDSTYCFFVSGVDSVNNKEPLGNVCQLSFTPAGSPLPLTWLDFTGVRRNDDALLNWITANERNTNSFIIERSTNGTAFKAIGKMPSSGRVNGTSLYDYTDKDIVSLNVPLLYYRIRQLDNDGHFTYSKIISIRIDQDKVQPLITAYPNPFNENITLKVVPAATNDKTNYVELFSAQGVRMYRKEINMQGSITIPLNDLQKIASGMYFLKVTINGRPYSIKLMKY